MTSENVLKTWRKLALGANISSEISVNEGNEPLIRRLERINLLNEIVLCLTQELLDMHILKGGESEKTNIYQARNNPLTSQAEALGSQESNKAQA